ncbi:hypothetical protein A2J03_24230 [Rhodococcus sp. EPR-157]|uniref:DUF6188 family protein n=1 Tax=Rhodococcus sp. EPR-157 TaxID=1813677 RepID=UPI0007BB3E40|nr:DUF6188 family protein [Rhodococcus sp. EPR-157]KZF06611.1 hypothetical protein A2J03_24230 [Rhodococcus sp. EPR-157]
MDIPIVSQSIESVDFGFSLALWTSAGYEIRIESAFHVSDSVSGDFEGVPDDKMSSSTALNGLLGRMVEVAQATDGGDLHLGLDDGVRIDVPADADFEAWTVAGPNGMKVVSEAGGGLATWNLDVPDSGQ